MVAFNPIQKVLSITVTMHQHAKAGEWDQLRSADDQRTKILTDALKQNSSFPTDSNSIKKIHELQADIVSLAVAERRRMTQEYQASRSKIKTSNYYLSDGSPTRPRKPPKSGSPVDKEVN